MTTYPEITLLSDDWVCRFQDGGFDALISSIAPGGYTGSLLLTKLNEFNDISYCNADMLAQYLADRQAARALTGISLTGGPEKVGEIRTAAPADLGNDANGIWFSTPATGTYVVRWYRNGLLVTEREQDLSVNRSATLNELGAVTGDVVQVCLVDNGIVGWWGRKVV